MNKKWHQHILRVHYQDTDQMSVAHHGTYVGWFEIGRTEMMRNKGIAYNEMESLGLLLPVLDMNIQYRSSAYYDDCLSVFTKVKTFSPVRLEFEYEVRRVENKTPLDEYDDTVDKPYGKLLAKGTTLHMWVNEKWKPARIDKAAPEVYALLQSN